MSQETGLKLNMINNLKSLPKISVVTVCFNSEKTILETIKSFEEQDYTNKELIIIDGGSNDNTLGIINNSHVQYGFLSSEKDKGIYDAINKGINNSSGDLIGLLHSDDIFANKKCLSKIAKKYSEEKTHGIYGDLEYVSSTNSSKVIRKWKSGYFKKYKFIFGWMPPHPTLYLEKEAYLRFGLYKTSYKIAADYELILRYFWSNSLNLSYIPETIVQMRVGGASNKSFKNILQKSKEDVRALKANNLIASSTLFFKNFRKLKQFF